MTADPQASGLAPDPRARREADIRSFASELEPTVAKAIRDELDQVVPHVLRALKSNEGVDALVARLDSAERKLADRDRRPIVSRIHRLLSLVRRLDLPQEVHQTLVSELEDVLLGAGFTEFGEVGEPIVAGRHEVLDGVAVAGAPVVAEVFEPGLETLGEVVLPARVRVANAAAVVGSRQSHLPEELA